MRPEQRFCNGCGAPLAAPAAADAGARKVVSIVFADLVGSTALHERLDAESMRRFMDRYYGAMRAAVEAERGSVTQLLGDGVKAVFGAPRVAEDDAIRAVRAAVAMQQAFAALAAEHADRVGKTGLRVAVNTGEVVASDEAEIIGDPVNVAARLQAEARDGDVVVGEATRRLVAELVTLAPLGSFTVKGRAEPVAAWRVVSLERPAGASAAAFVGREAELRRLLAVQADAIASRRARLAVILGSPGLGKSRLIAELGRRLEGAATVLLARCDPAGSATFAPLAASFRAFLGLADAVGGDSLRKAIAATVQGEEAGERDRIAAGISALLAGSPASPEEGFFAVRRFLGGLAATGPLVLAIDDLQWAEPLLLDLVEHLVEWTTDVPLLVLVAARPELREARSSLATPGGLVAEVVTLAGLDAGSATRLAASVIGADALPAAVAGRVLATSEGNPLFVGELVRMLVQDGALKREGDRWTAGAELAALEMPPTIQALLAARLERLRPEERTVLERAAVIGPRFSRAALKELLPREVPDLDRHLEALRRSELVEPDTGWFLGDPALRFHHVLIRDAAYRRVLKEKRAELHERFADWVAARVGEAAAHDETLGWHLEQAHRNLVELGPVDAHGRTLGERAARVLGVAGRRALARDDVALAAGLLGRALERLDPEDPARADLALDWCEALLAAGEVGAAARAIDELGRFTGGSARLRAWHTCFAGERAALTDPQALRATAEAVAAAAAELAAAGDAPGEAKAHFVHAMALQRLGQVGACEAALDRALAAARRGGDRRRANAVLAGAPLAALWGPSPVTRASGRCLDVVRVLRITQGAPAVEAVALRCQGVLEALRGRSDAARRMIATSRKMVEELGVSQGLFETDFLAGLVEWIEGDAAAAERSLRSAYEGLRQHGLGIDAARAAAYLGRTLLAQDRAAEAEALSHESEALAGDDLQAAITWRRLRAEALARRGERALAVEFARAAVEIAAATDALLYHADARRGLANALRAAGRGAEADAEDARAIELWEAKGATLLAEQARGSTAAGPAAPAPIERGNTLRRVGANAASANLERLAAAAHAREADEDLLAEGVECVHHPTRALYDRQGLLAQYSSFLKLEDGFFRQELLATLGNTLALSRVSFSAAGFAGQMFDVGPYEREEIWLVDVDASGRQRRVELFAADRLGAAAARLYERHAELFPEGPERQRAVATALSVAASLAPVPDRHGETFAPEIEFADHRALVALPAARGAHECRRRLESWWETVEEASQSVDDVLELRPDGLLVRRTERGCARAGGGSFERTFLVSYCFGADGLLSRIENFDADTEADALARFDALTAEPAPRRPARRRVRPNAATAHAARLEEAIGASDSAALAALHADGLRVVHHETGAELDRRGTLDWWRMFLGDREAELRLECLASLGDALALVRVSWSGTASEEESFEIGAFEGCELDVIEVDGEGCLLRADCFGPDRLSDAVACLYERHAELVPEGPGRGRSAATARSAAALFGAFEFDSIAALLSPAVEFIDHRPLGLPPRRGAEEYIAHFRTLFAAADNLTGRSSDVLALRSDALLLHATNAGTERSGGGVFERNFLVLFAFGADGLVMRNELFASDDVEQALARFDELVARPAAARPVRRRVCPNAATASEALLEAAIAARDSDAISAHFAELHEVVDHQRGATYDREGSLTTWRGLLRARDVTYRADPLATLGDSLALCRQRVSASGFAGGSFDVGAYEIENVLLAEIGDHGQRRRSEIFAADHLGDAVVLLYERHAELLPAGPERERAAAIARSVASWTGPIDADRVAAAAALDLECVDHRTLGTWSLRSREALRENLRAFAELAEGMHWRYDDVLALGPDAILVHRTHLGTDRASGGCYERPHLLLRVFGPDGLVERAEWFDSDRETEALARFEELRAASAAPPPFANAATRGLERFEAAWDARDWERMVGQSAPGFRRIDRRTVVNAVDLDRDGFIDWLRASSEIGLSRLTFRMLATRGERLVLARALFEATGPGMGPAEVELLSVQEVDEAGAPIVAVVFDPGGFDAAWAELDARYAAGEAAAHPHLLDTMQAFLRAFAGRDWEVLAARFAPDLVVADHRPLGWETVRGPAAYVDTLRSLVDLAPDARLRLDHVRMSDRGLLWAGAWVGTRDGGAFETPWITVSEHGAGGTVLRFDQYDPDQLDEARARFEALRPDPLGIPANAASRARDRIFEAVAAEDWDAIRALISDEFRGEDRGKRAQLSGGVELMIESLRFFQAEFGRADRELIATAGERVAIERLTWTRAPAGGGLELEQLMLSELDADGRLRAVVRFDPEARAEAFAEAQCRFLAGEAGAVGGQAPFAALGDAVARRDWEACRACLADDFVFCDRRVPSLLGTLGPDPWVESLRTLSDFAPDLARESLRILAWNASGRVDLFRSHGTVDGGAFENLFLRVALSEGGRIRNFESFDPGDTEQALARFDELSGSGRPCAA